jgi:hypothetical protein
MAYHMEQQMHFRKQIAAIFVGLMILPTLARADDPKSNDAPSSKFELEVNGKTQTVEVDKPFDVTIAGQAVHMKLHELPFKIFDKAGIKFQYPSSFGWEMSDANPGVTIYTLSGNDNKFIISYYPKLMDDKTIAASTIGAMLKAYGAGNVQKSPVSVTLGKTKLDGQRLDVNLAGHRIVQDIYTFKTAGGTVGMIIQDSPKEDGEQSEEAKSTMEMVSKTFEVTDEAK